jgi:hypothetical protein
VFSRIGLKAVLFRFEFGEGRSQLLDLGGESVDVCSPTVRWPAGRGLVLDLGEVNSDAHLSVIARLSDQS